jgi:hypothetical protein
MGLEALTLMIALAGGINPWALNDATYKALVQNEIAAFGQNEEWVAAERVRCFAPTVTDREIGFQYWAARYWNLVNKRGEIVLLRPNALQRSYLANRSAENVILKYRKGGASSVVDAMYYWRCRRSPYQHAYIMAHVADSTDELYQRVLFAHDRMPGYLAAPIRRSNKTVLHFADNDSYLRLMTAGGKGSGRAADADAIHLSEAAHYPDLDGTLAAVGEAKRSDAWLDIESTPNGFDRFRSEFKDAKAGKTTRTAQFFPWYFDPANSTTLERGERVTPTASERPLVAAWHLKPEQLKWRRAKIADLKDLFAQEHPEDDESCFLIGGVPKFDNSILGKLVAVVEARVLPLNESELRAAGDPYRGSGDNGRWVVWRRPIKGHRYVIGADVAEGLPGRANSAAGVLDVTGAQAEQVAEWCGHVSPGDYAHVLAKIGGWYNGALVAAERNNHGHATLRALRNEVGYAHIYKHRHYDQRAGGAIKRPGWPTDGKTRPIMFTDLRDCLDKGWMIVRSAEFLKECMAMQAGDEDLDSDDDRPSHSKVLRDRIFAWGIAWQVRGVATAGAVA